MRLIISNKRKPFKSTSCTSSSDDFIQCKISFILFFVLSLMQSFCIIHEDRFGSTKNHGVGREVIYCVPQPKERKEVLYFCHLDPCNGDYTISLVNLFQCFMPTERALPSILPRSAMQQFSVYYFSLYPPWENRLSLSLWTRLLWIGRLLSHPLQASFRISNPNLCHFSL